MSRFKSLFSMNLISLIFSLNLFAQAPPSPVDVKVEVTPEKARVGEIVTFSYTITPQDEWHVYSLTTSEDGPMATEIQITDKGPFKIEGGFSQNKPKVVWDEGFEINVEFFEHAGTFSKSFEVSDGIKAGDYTLKGDVTYQLCNETTCLPPTTKEFSFNVLVEEGEPREEFAMATTISQGGKSSGSGKELLETDFWAFIGLAISAGLLALLTPCVFPMIPITVSFFTKQAGNKSKSIKLATAYCFGIIATYVILGVLLSVFIGGGAANAIAANPWVNLFITALFIAFAFSLFGMFELELPTSLVNYMNLKSNESSGYWGVTLMGFTFTLAAFTCTVQFIGLLMVAVSQGSFLMPIIGMTVFASVFATPFFLLALFPQMIANLPKSGGWLNSTKVVMGFIELAAAFKFFSNADLIFQWEFMTRPIMLTAWVIIFGMAGFYLLGKIRLPHDSKLEIVGVPRLFLSIIFFTSSLYLARGLIGEPLQGWVDSWLPPETYGASNILASNGGGQKSGKKYTAVHDLDWLPEYKLGIERAKKTGKPIFVDFTGYTCTNCRLMEKNVMGLPDIFPLLRDEFVLVQLYTDGGDNYKAKQEFQIQRFQTTALPFYAIMDENDVEVATFPGYTNEPDKFRIFLEEAITKHKRSISQTLK